MDIMKNLHARAALRFVPFVVLALLAAPAAHAQTTTVSGTVTKADGSPADYADVNLSGNTGTESTLTDEAGAFAFPAVGAGSYKLEAFATGFVSDVLVIEVAPGTPQRHTIKLRSTEGT